MTTTTDTRKNEMLLMEIKGTARNLMEATGRLHVSTQRYMRNLTEGMTGMTPDVRDVQEITKIEAELKALVKMTKIMGLDQDEVQGYINDGLGSN